jgi:hypothetical protein
MSPSTLTQSQPLQAVQPNCHPALRSLRVQETEAEIIIYGRVSSYYLKQLAQETLMQARGTREVVNRVTVVAE